MYRDNGRTLLVKGTNITEIVVKIGTEMLVDIEMG